MNADILKRMVRAIADGSQSDLERIARRVVDSERKSGHAKLATQLEDILNKPKPKRNGSGGTTESDRGLSELPTSRRHGEQLTTLILRDSLEHHMVLPLEIEERFARIEKEYAARERLGAYGLKNRKTILLYGPPGCGKSLGAKRLAWNTGLPLLKVRFDALISSYFGESAINLRSVFEAAKERPSVLLLDECDFIARSRTNSRDIGEASRIVNSLLQLMEEYDAPGILVATTNIEDSLDTALFRRFDDVFQVPPPGPDEIDKLLKTTLSAVKCSDSIDWPSIVKRLQGESAAMTVKAAKDAAKASVLNGEKIVTERLLVRAIRELKRAENEED
ncbi:MAG TPA: ATP-binding protein [Pirellulales bacterium]|nr:ATP-binding protein [Pirellulales bacterium]